MATVLKTVRGLALLVGSNPTPSALTRENIPRGSCGGTGDHPRQWRHANTMPTLGHDLVSTPGAERTCAVGADSRPLPDPVGSGPAGLKAAVANASSMDVDDKAALAEKHVRLRRGRTWPTLMLGAGPPVLLQRCPFSSSFRWRQVITQLSLRFRRLAPDGGPGRHPASERGRGHVHQRRKTALRITGCGGWHGYDQFSRVVGRFLA
jgi:hypothetical protein